MLLLLWRLASPTRGRRAASVGGAAFAVQIELLAAAAASGEDDSGVDFCRCTFPSGPQNKAVYGLYLL